MANDHIDLLGKAGFSLLGTWQQDATGITGEHSTQPGLYAFIVDDVIKYVGIAENGLQQRMRDYAGNQREVGRGAKKRPVHMELFAALSRKEIVMVYTFVPEESKKKIDWNGLTVDLLFGLEAGMIRQLKPARNRKGVRDVTVKTLD